MVDIEEVSDDEVDHPPSNVQLGFSEPIRPQDAHVIGHRSPCWWKDWDGGQLGGRPSWLQPQDLPRALNCQSCKGTMQFLCQLYVPLDNLPRAFHRSFYIFACPSCSSGNSSTGIRVLRVQLPQDNPFYPEENASGEGWKKHLPIVNLCRVCGQKATGKCPLQQVWFCGKRHQREYKRSTNSQQSEEEEDPEEAALVEEESQAPSTEPKLDAPDCFLPSVYAESELVVEQEEPSRGKAPDDDDNDDDEDEIEAMFPCSPNADGHDSDEDLEQEDLNEMVTGTKALDQTSTKDPATNAFYKRIQGASEQCLRYTMEWRHRYDSTTTCSTDESAITDDSNPLWIQSDHQPTDSDIPPCPYCQAPRAFEFQLMPQMLHFLHVHRRRDGDAEQAQKNETAKQALIAADSIIANSDPSQIPPSFAEAKAKAMEALQQDLNQRDCVEWGVVAIYTCTKSCNKGNNNVEDGLGAYQEEFAWLQPALDGQVY